MTTGRSIQIASTFDCTLIGPSLHRSVVDSGIADGLGFVQFTQMSEYMLTSAPGSAETVGTVVMLRLEDWLREYLKSSRFEPSHETAIRHEFRPRVEEFVSQLGILSRLGKQLWFLACPSSGWISERHKLEALCRTYTNLVIARIRDLPHVTLLNWPSSLPTGRFEDPDADTATHIPFSPDAFEQLGESVGRQMARTRALNGSTGLPQVGSPKAPELAAYLGGLQVRVHLAPACSGDRVHVERIIRTVASFSLTGERPTISDMEIDKILDRTCCILVTVLDRISDYGPAGLIILRADGSELIVESMALSCTVLGKQVELAILSSLGRIATGLKCLEIVFEYRPGGRNQPMLTFLQQITDKDSNSRYVIPTDVVEARIADVAANPGAWTATQTGIPDDWPG